LSSPEERQSCRLDSSIY